jgi:peptidyl-tRNA hydrolase, PTH1 family
LLLIVGLGNPGDKYQNSHHNFGFLVLDALQKKLSSPLNYFSLDKKSNSMIFKHHELLLAKPQTFMNLSGNAVQSLLNFYKLECQNLVVIHDDFDLPLGKIKIVKKGGDAGHHGIESIIKSLGTPNFVRIRLGIYGEKKLSDNLKADKIVLQNFSSGEVGTVKHVIKKVIEAVNFLENHTIEETMNKYN